MSAEPADLHVHQAQVRVESVVAFTPHEDLDDAADSGQAVVAGELWEVEP